MKRLTLLFLRKEGQILLAMKKRGFGQGKWNGVGGKLEPGERAMQAAIRECQEEIGVTPHSLKHIGHLDFFEAADPAFHHNCHVFVSESWEGEPAETEEMRPQWFALNEIPYNLMWADDELWLPHLIKGNYFDGEVIIGENTVVSHTIKTVPNLTRYKQEL